MTDAKREDAVPSPRPRSSDLWIVSLFFGVLSGALSVVVLFWHQLVRTGGIGIDSLGAILFAWVLPLLAIPGLVTGLLAVFVFRGPYRVSRALAVIGLALSLLFVAPYVLL